MLPPAEYLKHWRAAATKRLLFDNRDGRSVRDLLGCGITASDREQLLLQGQRWLHKGDYTCDDGTVTAHYERRLDVPALTVQAWLGYHADGTARCAHFWWNELHDGPAEHALPRFGGYLDERPSVQAVEVDTETGPIRTMVVGYATADPKNLHSTTEQDAANLQRLQLALRTRDGIPFPEDLVAFREHPFLRMERHHASAALGWDGRRWLQLEQGAWPSADEAAQLRGLRQPAGFYAGLVRRHSARYGYGAAPRNSRTWSDFNLLAASSTVEPLADARAVRNAQTGYQRYTIEPLGQLANHLAYQAQPSVERFWLLVFLCDAVAYGWKGQGFTGLRYQWTAAGPAPEQAAQRLAALCAESIIRIHGHGAQASLSPDPIYYPPDYGMLWLAEDLVKRLSPDWMKLTHQELVECCKARVLAEPMMHAEEWMSYDAMLGASMAR